MSGQREVLAEQDASDVMSAAARTAAGRGSDGG
jgi:hypothetical protein